VSVVIECPVCELAGGPFELPEAERLAGTHDDLLHAGRLTTEVVPAEGLAAAGGASR
jgi:hypothetical protein